MTKSYVVDEDGDIEGGGHVLESLEIGVFVLSKVHGEGLGLGRRIGGSDLRGQCLEFRSCSGDEEDVVALLRKLKCEFLANAIRGTSYDCPTTFRTKFGELILLDWLSCDTVGVLTGTPGIRNRLARSRT